MQEIFLRRLPHRSAADHGGWRYEYITHTYRHLSTTRAEQPPGTPLARL
jgi:hypothetical protein